jgi:hypothetical protein
VRADLLCVKNQVASSANSADLRGAFFLTKKSKCPRGSSGILDTERFRGQAGSAGGQGERGFTGPQGPRGTDGPRGPAGTVNIQQCRRVSSAANSSSGLALSSVECNPGEFLLNWGYSTLTPQNFSAINVYPIRLSMRYWIVGGQPSSIPCCADAETSYEAGSTPTYNLFVDGTCCPY